MTIPIGLILIFFSLASFYYFNQKRKIKEEQRRLKMEEKLEQLLKTLKQRNEPVEEKE